MTQPQNRWWHLAKFPPQHDSPPGDLNLDNGESARQPIRISLTSEVEDKQFEDYPFESPSILSGSYELTAEMRPVQSTTPTYTGNIELRLDTGLLVTELPTTDYPRQEFFKILRSGLDELVTLERFIPVRENLYEWANKVTNCEHVSVLDEDGRVKPLSDLCSDVSRETAHWPIEHMTVQPDSGETSSVTFHVDRHFRGVPTDREMRARFLQRFETHVCKREHPS